MRRLPLYQLPIEHAVSFIRTLPCLPTGPAFQSLHEALVPYCQLFMLQPGELLLRQGEFDSRIYWLIAGAMAVYAAPPHSIQTPVSLVPAGEFLGELAPMLDEARGATVRADRSYPRHLLLALDTAPLGELDDFGVFDAISKAYLFRYFCQRIEQQLQFFAQQFTQGIPPQLRDFAWQPPTDETDLAGWLGYLKALARQRQSWNLLLHHSGERLVLPPMVKVPANLIKLIEAIWPQARKH